MAAKIKYEIINGFKICTACQENKAVGDYPKCRKTQTGFGAKCKLCKYIHDNNESKFTIGMTWENYGKDGWEIDHIIPMDLFNHNGDQNHPAFLACWSLDNLQPLWATTLIAIQHGESKSYIGNSNKQHRIKIIPEIQSYLDKVNGN